MGVTVLHHYNIVTDKIDESVKFYEDVIGLKKGERPELPDPGRVALSRRNAGGPSSPAR